MKIGQPFRFLGPFEAVEDFGFGQCPQCSTQLPLRQVGAEAEVPTMAKGQVIVRATSNIEAVRIVENPRIAVGRPVPQRHMIAGPDRLAVQFHIANRRPSELNDGSGPSHNFVDRRVDETVGVIGQTINLVGVVDQCQNATTQRVSGGLVASVDEKAEIAVQFLFGELSAIDVGVDQNGAEVVGWLVALTLD